MDLGVNIEREQYLDQWSEFMIKFWIEKMNAEQVGVSERADGSIRYSTGALRQSLTTSILKQSHGNSAKIDHIFNHYGMYLDGGVFPGTKGSGGQNYKSNPNRKAKPWRSLKYWYSQRRLQEKMVELTGSEYLRSLITILQNS